MKNRRITSYCDFWAFNNFPSCPLALFTLNALSVIHFGTSLSTQERGKQRESPPRYLPWLATLSCAQYVYEKCTVYQQLTYLLLFYKYDIMWTDWKGRQIESTGIIEFWQKYINTVHKYRKKRIDITTAPASRSSYCKVTTSVIQ